LDAKLKALFLLIVNLVVNGTLWAVIPGEYKVFVILAVNLIQVAIAFYDPTYVLQNLGLSKGEYKEKLAGREIKAGL
jgi:hypothetical protein